MIGDRFTKFEYYEKPSRTESIKFLNSPTELLSTKLEQIGAEIQNETLDKVMTDNKDLFNKKTVDEVMGNIHYQAAILRDLVKECISLEEKAGLRK